MPDGEAIRGGLHGAASRVTERIMRQDSRPLFVVPRPLFVVPFSSLSFRSCLQTTWTDSAASGGVPRKGQ